MPIFQHCAASVRNRDSAQPSGFLIPHRGVNEARQNVFCVKSHSVFLSLCEGVLRRAYIEPMHAHYIVPDECGVIWPRRSEKITPPERPKSGRLAALCSRTAQRVFRATNAATHDSRA